MRAAHSLHPSAAMTEANLSHLNLKVDGRILRPSDVPEEQLVDVQSLQASVAWPRVRVGSVLPPLKVLGPKKVREN